MSEQEASLEALPVVPRLSDGLVMLRGLELADAAQLAINCQDEGAQRWIPNLPSPYLLADAEAYLKDFVQSGWLAGDRHTYAVSDQANEVFYGTIDLHLFRGTTAEVGINIGPAARGRGVALAAVKLLLDYAFNGLNLKHLYWRAEAPNWASRKLAWKAGFRFEAELRAFGDNRGESVDQWLLSLASDEPREPQAAWAGPEKPVG